MSDASERASDFVRDLGEAARNNPLSAALIGMGVLWLFTGRRGLDQLPGVARNVWQGTASGFRSGAENAQEGARTAANTISDRGGAAADSFAENGAELVSSVKDYASGLPDMAGSMYDDVRSNVGELFRAQPLALGVVGIAIGAAIASSLPATDLETSYLGESNDFVKEKAGAIIGEQAERATDIGRKVVDAVADEARQQGLTADGLKAAATQMSDKVRRVAGAAARQSKPPNQK
jgi:hypothetical protein